MALWRRIIPIVTLIVLAAAPVWSQVPGFYQKKTEEKKTELPVIISNNLILVLVSINNGPPVNFLLDTGVKTNILFSKTFGDQIGLKYTRKLDLVGADGNSVLTASVSPNNYMDLGFLEGIHQTILVLDQDFMELERVIGLPVHGVLGYEFFKYNPVKIDYDQQMLTFYKPETLRRKPFGYQKHSIKIENSKPYIMTKVKQTSSHELNAKLLIDTGANHGLLLNMETSSEIKLPKEHIESELGRSLGGDLYGFVARTRLLQIGNIRFSDLLTSFPEETEFSYVIKESGRQGSVGSEVLGRMTLIFDYTRDKMYMKKASTYATPFEFDMSGVTPRIVIGEEKIIYASQVRENSPAALAGLEARDEFVKINKIPVDFWELPDLIKLLRSEEGKEIFLEVRRFKDETRTDFELKEVKFKLKRQI
jgi:predicted aspartyl protease